jgi:hypothetical protein
LGLLAFCVGLIIWLYVELRYQSQMADRSVASTSSSATSSTRARCPRPATPYSAAAGGGGALEWGASSLTGLPLSDAGDVRVDSDWVPDLSRVDSPGAIPDDFTLLYTPEWSDHLAFERLPPERLAPLTHEAQRMLYAHQFPQVCKGRKYFVSSGNEELAGLGSHIHIASVHMAIAFFQNRIFIWEPWAGYIYTDADTCGEPAGYVPPGPPGPVGSMGSGGWVSCFFRSPTNCTLEDSSAPGVDAVHFGTGGIGVQWGIYPDTLPPPFYALWLKAGFPLDKALMKYWWRGQVAAFITRFHPRALAKLRELRTQVGRFMLNHTAPGRLWQNATWLPNDAAAVPLPRGTVSIHIRHGDKKKEMTLIPTEKYLLAADELVKLNPFGYRKVAFMSTEDPGSIEEMVAHNLSNTWHWLWWDVPRLNSNGPEQLGLFNMRRGELTFIWWLQMFIALEADAWVGTRGSNWNRLIDELRCVWVPKCQNVYVEVGMDESWRLPNGEPHYSW